MFRCVLCVYGVSQLNFILTFVFLASPLNIQIFESADKWSLGFFMSICVDDNKLNFYYPKIIYKIKIKTISGTRLKTDPNLSSERKTTKIINGYRAGSMSKGLVEGGRKYCGLLSARQSLVTGRVLRVDWLRLLAAVIRLDHTMCV